MTRFLVASDLQIGVGGDLLEPGERLAEQEAVWAWILDVAHQVDASAVLYGGDAFEGPIPTPEQYEAFARPLRATRIPVVAVSGNGRHDAATRTPNALERVRDTPLFHAYREPYVHYVARQAQVAVLPWAPVGYWVAAQAGGDRDAINEQVAAALLQVARGLYADMDESRPRILLGHWHVSSATTVNGMGAGEIFREPLLDYGALEAIGFDAIVLGHNHKPQLLGERGFHVGSAMPCNFGEAATGHVVWLLDVTAGEPMSVFQIPVPSTPLVTLTLDVVRGDSERLALERGDEYGRGCLDRVLARSGGVDGAIVKVIARGSAEAARRWDLAGLKRNLLAAGARKVWDVIPDIDRGDVVRGGTLDDLDDDGALARWLELDGTTGRARDALLDLHATIVSRAAA